MVAQPRLNQRYTLVRPLGRGGEGDVHLALDTTRDDTPRALKFVRGVDDPAARARLLGEFRRLAPLDHPRLVHVYDLQVLSAPTSAGGATFPAGTPFFTADFVDGVDPARYLAGLPAHARPAALLGIAEDVAAALAHVHAAGLVHHDVKPPNLLVGAAQSSAPGRTTLLDLGLSAARAALGVPRGTPAYMAPEAFAGVEDPRIDLYALGATLYEIACGRPPFAAGTPRDLVRAILEDPLEPLRVLAPWVPEDLEQVILRLCSRAADQRHSSAVVLLEDLARIREAHGWTVDDESAAPRGRGAKGGRSGGARAAANRDRRDELPAALLPPPLVGRDDELRTLDAVVAALAEGRAASRVVRVSGAPGAGKSRLIAEAIRRHQLRAAAGRSAPLTIIGDTWSRLAAAVDLSADLPKGAVRAEDADRARSRLVDAAFAELSRRSAAGERLLVHLADAVEDDRSAALLVLAGAAGGMGGAGWLLVAETAEIAADVDAVTIPLAPLSPDKIAEIAARMLGRTPPSAWTAALAAATGGVPRLAVEAIRAAAARAGVDRAATVPVAEVLDAKGFAATVARRVEALPASSRALVDALAVWGERAAPSDLAGMAGSALDAAWAEVASLVARELLRRSGDAVEFPSRAHARAALGAVAPRRRVALHREARRLLSDRSPRPVRAWARHLAALGPAAEAIAACREAAAVARAEGDLAGADAHLVDALAHATGNDAAALGVERAELAVVLGRYDDAIAAAAAATAAEGGEPVLRRRAALVAARARVRRGNLDAAQRDLTRLAADDPADEEAAGALARLLVTRAAYAEALAAAGTPEDDPPGGAGGGATLPMTVGRAVRLEAAGLAALYSGDLARAETCFAKLRSGAATAGDRVLLGRGTSLLGLVAHGRGDVASAAARYSEALEEARAAGDVHGAAVYALNCATALVERGLHGEVLVATAAAIRDLRRIGRVTEIPAALYNRGAALLALGEVAAARRAADQALAEARERKLPLFEIYAGLLSGDVTRREPGEAGSRAAGALAAYDAAAALAAEKGNPRERALVHMARAEVLAEIGRAADARAALAEALEAASGDDDRDRIAVSAARVALSLGGGDGVAPALAALGPAARRLRETGRLDLAWRADLLVARLHARAGDVAAAAPALARARAACRDLVARAPEAHRTGMAADPDAQALAAAERASTHAPLTPTSHANPSPFAPTMISPVSVPHLTPLPPDAGAARSQDDGETRLRRLLLLSKRLNSELRLERLLDDVIDTVIELTCAERGFLLLTDETGELAIRVARNIDQRSLAAVPEASSQIGELAVSRSIAEQAIRTGEPVLTIDAAFDERFGGAASVSALKLRSVLAVPLRLRGAVVGAVYVDHRYRRGAFTQEAALLILDLADVAAIALHNARLAEENERRRAEVAALNARLEADLAREREALGSAREALDSVRATARAETLGLRYPYDALVGRSPRMLELLRLVDRATATHLPVVIHGESGTGKELVARALHENGARRARPFVPINCAAVPETLLEAELFGHARGAFTGADRDRRGLFEIADGGTLFLDEIADTSPAMQTKLLRVLQDGTVRRVGAERAVKVDVRVVAASNRDLRRLVDEGQFREDLFYRLHVIRIDVPALRERSEDIPALVTHFLHKLVGAAGGQMKKVDRAAMSRLVAHPWPGNVRELENELARAAALGGEVIGLGDLSPQVAAADPGSQPASPDDLSMKPRVERLERALLREALGRAAGNQTTAARLLGLSRFGLQKKLKRYNL